MSQAKILVIRGGAIGDFILTLPVLAALRQQFPAARLEVLGYSHIAQLAQAYGLADAVRSIEAGPLARFFARAATLDNALEEYFNGFAIIISYLYDPDLIFQTNIARCSKAQFIVGPHRPDERSALHATDVLLEPLKRLAIFEPDPVPRLGAGAVPPPGEAPGQVPTLALHPGSGSEAKNWPEPKWRRLIQTLLRTAHSNLLLVGGEAEGERLTRLLKGLSHEQHPLTPNGGEGAQSAEQGAAPGGRVRLAQGLPLPELAAQLSRCDFFVGHDSGISHLAAALGVPGLVLWSETAEAVWRPRSERVTVLRAPRGIGSISVERVVEHCQRSIPIVRER